MTQTNSLKEAARQALAPIAEDMAAVERIIAQEMQSGVGRV